MSETEIYKELAVPPATVVSEFAPVLIVSNIAPQIGAWGTSFGAWGDMLCGLAYFRKRIGEGNIIYYGKNVGIPKFLAAQPFIGEVIHVVPKDTASYKHFIERDVHMYQPEEAALLPMLEGTGFGVGDVVRTHLEQNVLYAETVELWEGGLLPGDVRAWAARTAEGLPKRFYIVQPFSLNSNSYSNHWPGWGGLMNRLLAQTAQRYVLVGHEVEDCLSKTGIGVRDRAKHPYLTDLTNECPSMMHLFALASHAQGVITTSNSLAHWCQNQGLPCVVLCNSTSSRPDYFFRKVLNTPTLKVLHRDATVDDAMESIFLHLLPI